jgi:hypothetical protein
MAYSRQPQVVIANSGALKQTPLPTTTQPPGIVPVELEAKIATKTTLGVVQIGDGINVTPEGVISVDCDYCGGSEQGCNTILVGEDYESESSDCYIGVDSLGPVSVSLPVDISNGHQIVIKAEMDAPMGNRKVTVKTTDGSKIDGAASVTLSVPYSCLHLIYRGQAWHIISLYKKD